MGPKREHYEKYAALAQEFAQFDIASYVPVSAERIKAALAAGDEHLNSIGLATWDKACDSHYRTMLGNTVVSQRRKHFQCPTCKCNGPEPEARELWKAFWRKSSDGTKRAYYSLAERCSLLKHVATYQMGGIEPPGEDE